MAAGHGKRMNADRPKPLLEVAGKPMIQYILEAVQESGICENPIIVVSPDNIDFFKEIIGESYQFAIQEQQLGTAHAVKSACHLLDLKKPTIVLNGDHPTISANMLLRLLKEHDSKKATITLGVVTVPSYGDWYTPFESWGRIIRDTNGNIQQIIEVKDSSVDQLNIKEVNPNYFCFDTRWMCDRLPSIDNNNIAGEYYLTKFVSIAVLEGQIVTSSPITPEEGIGVNTPEHRDIAERILLGKK